MTDTLARTESVFQEVFEDDDIHLTPETTAEDIEGWDSVMHVNLMLRLEKVFGIRFSSAEVASLKNVGELTQMIDSRLAAAGK
jgi:acyl carrier protein